MSLATRIRMKSIPQKYIESQLLTSYAKNTYCLNQKLKRTNDHFQLVRHFIPPTLIRTCRQREEFPCDDHEPTQIKVQETKCLQIYLYHSW